MSICVCGISHVQSFVWHVHKALQQMVLQLEYISHQNCQKFAIRSEICQMEFYINCDRRKLFDA